MRKMGEDEEVCGTHSLQLLETGRGKGVRKSCGTGQWGGFGLSKTGRFVARGDVSKEVSGKGRRK